MPEDKKMEGFISLNKLNFFAQHGVGSQERKTGNEFWVSIRLKVDLSEALKTDEVKDTVSYAEVFEVVKNEMKIPSRLLEHVCGRIAKQLFHRFSTIEQLDIVIEKRNPPMGADLESAGVELKCLREDFIREETG